MKSLIIAFSMYSKLPMPQLEWKKENMRYVMCFFPFVGVLTGILLFFADRACSALDVNIIFRAVLMSSLPFFINGGIHMDGFLDTVDALSSNGDKDKKLSILKDPNSGAFAIIWGIIYFMITFAAWTEIKESVLPYVFIIYTLSRTLSGLSVAAFKTANNSGLASMFQNAANKRVNIIILIIELIVQLAIFGFLYPVGAALCICAAALVFLYHYYVCRVKFGGITGDLAGYFLQLCELVLLLSFAALGRF